MEKFFFTIMMIAGACAGVFGARSCDRAMEPTPQEKSCQTSCDPNRGIIHNNKCFCSNDWRQNNGK